jgi:VRR-NUC domain-containing protein
MSIDVDKLKAKLPNISAACLRLNGGDPFAAARAPAKFIPPPAPRTMDRDEVMEPSESASQQLVFKWWALVWQSKFGRPAESDLMAFPLGGKRTDATGALMKSEGARRGTVDMFLAVPRGTSHGLWIEMKKQKTGRIRPEQQDFMDARQASGYAVAVCWSAQEAIDEIERYLST